MCRKVGLSDGARMCGHHRPHSARRFTPSELGALATSQSLEPCGFSSLREQYQNLSPNVETVLRLLDSAEPTVIRLVDRCLPGFEEALLLEDGEDLAGSGVTYLSELPENERQKLFEGSSPLGVSSEN